MKNYRDAIMKRVKTKSIFKYDDLIITVTTEPDSLLESFCLTATVGKVFVGQIYGMSTNAYHMFTQPDNVWLQLDGASVLYADEGLAYLNNIMPQRAIMDGNGLEDFGFSDEEIDAICDKISFVNKKIADIAKHDISYRNKNIVFLDDVIVKPDYRRKGIFLKMTEVLEQWFGSDYSGAAYIYPLTMFDDGDDGDVFYDDDNAEENLLLNRTIATKLGWSLIDDFYALKLPEYILKIAKLGEEFRKYVPHIENDE